MASPLLRRLPRELRANVGKYLGIFLLMAVSIALTTGFLAAASSIGSICASMRDDYAIEDGRFQTAFEAPRAAVDAACAAGDTDVTGGVTIYDNFSLDVGIAGGQVAEGSTARAYAHRSSFDIAAYAEGRAPQAADEVALDRVFAAHAGLGVGDPVTLGGRAFTVCGIMTLPDYQALFEDNADFTLNALSFTVAEVTPAGFAALEKAGAAPAYTYSFVFEDRDLTDAERATAEADMAQALEDSGVTLSSMLDASANQGIGYAADDVDGDTSMWETLLAIIVAIMALAFVVITGSTIERESATIGTLVASGLRPSTLVAHYMALPCLVGTLAALVGNVCGYTVLEAPMRDLYYNSYSLPPYVATWSTRVFVMTTLVPLALLFGITALGLAGRLRHTPLQFLRHDTGRSGLRRGLRLPAGLSFSSRFRLRVISRNVGSFATLFVGICFATMLLLFGLAVMPTMEHYADGLRTTVAARHQYVLKTPVELAGTERQRDAWQAAWRLSQVPDPSGLGLSDTDLARLLADAAALDPDAHVVNSWAPSTQVLRQAEKFAVRTLSFTRPGGAGEESVAVYGIDENSRYWRDLDVADGKVAFGRGFALKFGTHAGDVVELRDAYEDATYELAMDSSYGSDADVCAYLGLDAFRELFGEDADYFNAYASDEELQIDAQYLAREVTPEDMDKIGAQMLDSMGDMTGMLTGLAVFIYLVFMYLLTKTVIDRSARSMALLKVLGYRDREVSRLYVRSLTETVVASLAASLPVVIGALTLVFRGMLMQYGGNIEIYVPAWSMVACVLAGLAAYAIVAAVHVRAIRRIPPEMALKTQE